MYVYICIYICIYQKYQKETFKRNFNLNFHCRYNAWVASREKQKGAGLDMEDRVLQHLTNDAIQTGFK